MAEAAGAQAPPTFKLVLVGDGGTGKVSTVYPGSELGWIFVEVDTLYAFHSPTHSNMLSCTVLLSREMHANVSIDHIRKAPLDRRI